MTGDAPRRSGWVRLAIAAAADAALALAYIAVLAVLIRLEHPRPVLLGSLLIAQVPLVSIVVWLVLYFRYTPERGVLRGAGYLAVLLLATFTTDLAGAGIASLFQHPRPAVAKTDDRAAVRSALDAADKAVAVTFTGQTGSAQLPTHALGEAGRIARAAKALMLSMSAARNQCHDVTSHLDFKRFAPQGLDKPGAFARAHKEIAAIRSALNGCNRDTDKVIDDYRASVTSAAIDADLKRYALKRLDARIASERTLRMAEREVVAKLADETDAMVSDLERARGRWDVFRGKLLFANQSALSAFRAHGRKLDALLHRLDALKAQEERQDQDGTASPPILGLKQKADELKDQHSVEFNGH